MEGEKGEGQMHAEDDSDVGGVEKKSWDSYGEDNGDEGKEDEQDNLCPQCQVGRGFTFCELHGDRYVEYKCIFCCQIASFNCGGNYFFCYYHHGEGVNSTQPGGDCKGDVEKCPLKVSHISNLEWKNDLFGYQKPKGFGLGCSMCREIKESGSEKKKKKVLEAEERYQLKLLETKAKM